MISQITPAGRQPGKGRKIDGTFGLSGAHQHPAGPRPQGKDMSRPGEILSLACIVDGSTDGVGTVRSGYAGGDTLLGLYGNSEGSAER